MRGWFQRFFVRDPEVRRMQEYYEFQMKLKDARISELLNYVNMQTEWLQNATQTIRQMCEEEVLEKEPVAPAPIALCNEVKRG